MSHLIVANLLSSQVLLPGPAKVLQTINSSPSMERSQLGPLYVKYSPSAAGTSDAKQETVFRYECCQTHLYVS